MEQFDVETVFPGSLAGLWGLETAPRHTEYFVTRNNQQGSLTGTEREVVAIRDPRDSWQI